MGTDRPIFRIDTDGAIRFARLSYRGYESRLRVPLVLWSLPDGPRRANMAQEYFWNLVDKYEEEHGPIPLSKPFKKEG